MEQNGVAPNTTNNKPIHDITVCLRNSEGISKLFFFNLSTLKTKSKFFSDKQLSPPNPNTTFIEIHCSNSSFKHHIELLTLLHLPHPLLPDSWTSVKSALGILQASISLQCDEITDSCVQYLEAVPWEDDEEEELLQVVPKLGAVAMPILARIQPVDLSATKRVFISAVRFAMSVSETCNSFADEVKIAAQEQIEYMLAEDDDTPLITADEDVKSEVKNGVSAMFSSFRKELKSLISESDQTLESIERRILQSLAGFQWLCNVLPKMELMIDFVSKWAEISADILTIIDDRELDSCIWSVKFKIIELTGKVLEAVGYGNVILPSSWRFHLVKKWIPYIRKMKPVLDSVVDEETGGNLYMMDENARQGFEGAIVSLVLALPSKDQAEILGDWMEKNGELGFPDLSEAFEIWCYRTKSAKRRMMEGAAAFEGCDAGSAACAGSDLSA